MFRFHFSKAHSICRNIYGKSRIFVFALKKHTSLFSDRKLKENPNSKQKHSLFTLEKHTVTWFLTFFTFVSSSKLNKSWLRPSLFIFHLTLKFLWIAFLNFLLLSIHPNRSTKAKNIKGASIRKDHKTVKVKQKILYLKVTTLYKSVSFVEQNKSYKKYYFTLDINSITPQYLYHSLNTYISTETFERNDLQ